MDTDTEHKLSLLLIVPHIVHSLFMSLENHGVCFNTFF